MDVGKWAFDNKKLVYFLIVVLLVGGLYSAYDMSKLEDPEIKVKMAMVVATRSFRTRDGNGSHRTVGKKHTHHR